MFDINIINLISALSSRCLWSLRCGPCGKFAREVPVRPGGICKEPVSQPANSIWEVVTSLAFSPHCLFFGHRTIIFRPIGR